MTARKCFVFSDRDDWIVFAPVSRLVMRTNDHAASKFRDFIDSGSNLELGVPAVASGAEATFSPRDVTVVCTNLCAQKCVYCYGTPAHANSSLLDPGFCRAALEFAAGAAAAADRSLRVFFHGVGEPTLVWPLFTECVGIARAMQEQFGVRVFIRLCTGGQVTESQAEWIADQIDEVHVSLDGPRDIQNQQRPRRDNLDSFDGPLNLAQAVIRKRKQLCVKATVTNASVNRLTEIVDFVARDIGPARLDLGMMFAPPWVSSCAATQPPWETYVTEFGKALAHGAKLGVRVQHPTISYETLCGMSRSRVVSHFCIVPPNIVTAFFDVPGEGAADPQTGAYGWYDTQTRAIRFDHEKRQRLEDGEPMAACQDCPCASACHGVAGVKGRFPTEVDPGGAVCLARVGVLKELLRHAAPVADGEASRMPFESVARSYEHA
jgi:sulfatase maturation enzyme AslB (radical SAM superfamily)